jgi:hypothetical protein
MSNWVSQVLMFVFVISPFGCAATSDIGRAIITERDGQPCFESSDPSAMRRLQAIVVYDISAPPSPSVWRVQIEPEQEFNRPGICVTYGQTFTSQKLNQPAMSLSVGRVYAVFLNAPSANPRDPLRGYEAEFCLVAQPGNAKPVVRQVFWDSKQGKRPYEEICGIRK